MNPGLCPQLGVVPPRSQAGLRHSFRTQTLLTGMGSDVPLEVKGVIEALPTVRTQVPLDIVVTFHVSVQHALVSEGLLADVTGEKVSIRTVPQGHLWVRKVSRNQGYRLAGLPAPFRPHNTLQRP